MAGNINRLIITAFFMASGFMNVSPSFGQDIPPGGVVQVTPCTLRDGHTVQDAVSMSRSLPRNENSPNLVVLREPLYVSSAFARNYDLLVMMFYSDLTELLSRQQAAQSDDSTRVRSRLRPADIMTCDAAARHVRVRRLIPSGEPMTGDATLTTSRVCELDPGRTVADAYRFVEGIASAYGAAGHSVSMALSNRTLGRQSGAAAGTRRVRISAVGSSTDSMMGLLDAVRTGLRPAEGLVNPMTCSLRSLWRTHVTHRTNN